MNHPSEGKKGNGKFPVKSALWLVYIYGSGAIAISSAIGDGASSAGFIVGLISLTIVIVLGKRHPLSRKPAPVLIDRSICLLVGLPAVAFLILAVVFSSWKMWYMFSWFLVLTIMTGFAYWKHRVPQKSEEKESFSLVVFSCPWAWPVFSRPPPRLPQRDRRRQFPR